MPFDLIPRTFFNLPSRIPSLFDDNDDWATFLPSSGLTVSEDENSVAIEAAMPGLEAADVEVTVDKGILWIRGSKQEKEEDKNKKYYRKASSSFSYRIVVPGNIDDGKEPIALFKNGVMKITFHKVAEAPARKLNIKTE